MARSNKEDIERGNPQVFQVRKLCTIILVVSIATVFATSMWTRADVSTVHAQGSIPVGGKLQADNACYVRLPDLPRGLYGGFGGYNEDTGVLTFAGGAEKRTDENTIAYYDLYALKLDGKVQDWQKIGYSAGGYLRDVDRGCREMATVKMSATSWLSVLGKDGCDGTADRRGDIKELNVGATANASGVRWKSGSGIAGSLPTELENGKAALARLFATFDTERNRLVFGQGTYNDELDTESQDEVYVATRSGQQWSVREIKPAGAGPVKRYGTCAAYVSNKDTGVDGVLILGGKEGGPEGSVTATYNEVWWLDFSKSQSGEWKNITSRFANQKDFGGRREGACAYNPQTKMFYSWFGRASSSIPDGASRSSGLWRVDLSNLADAAAPLTWERLAKDKNDLPGGGRRLIPNVYDWKHNRVFVLGGRGGSDEITEFKEVWALYPDVTGDACAELDPYAPFASVPTPTPPSTGPTATPGSGTAAPTRVPTATPAGPVAASVCPNLDRIVPRAVIDAAVANPSSVQGYDQRCNPNLPMGPSNGKRGRLGLQNPGAPYHPIFNGVVYKCGCP